MLIEIENPRQNPGERRRVFHNDFFDLYVWFDESDVIKGFQLCYDREGLERALTWHRDYGYSHEKIDSGEVPSGSGHYKMKPILVADGVFEHLSIAARFLESSAGIDPNIGLFVYEKILEYK